MSNIHCKRYLRKCIAVIYSKMVTNPLNSIQKIFWKLICSETVTLDLSYCGISKNQRTWVFWGLKKPYCNSWHIPKTTIAKKKKFGNLLLSWQPKTTAVHPNLKILRTRQSNYYQKIIPCTKRPMCTYGK